MDNKRNNGVIGEKANCHINAANHKSEKRDRSSSVAESATSSQVQSLPARSVP
jgi:hypothetical protein